MNLRQAYYEARFESLFLRAKGDEFQTLFERLMRLAYKADFMACRPWGSQGDRKNDGFLKSERRLFQVYAPNEMEAKKAVAKITEDFDGAKLYWGGDFDKWVFAHNADALPPHVQKLLLDFEKANPGLQLEPWGLDEFRLIFRRLGDDDLLSWLGAAPAHEANPTLGFEALRVVLESLGQRAEPKDLPVKDVPMGKIEANALSESVATLLKSGMAKAPLVESFFSRWHDQTLGERVASSFRAEYERLRGQMTPNQIFPALQVWAGGSQVGSPEHQVAVVAVLAFFFERCDIYEEPREPNP